MKCAACDDDCWHAIAASTSKKSSNNAKRYDHHGTLLLPFEAALFMCLKSN